MIEEMAALKTNDTWVRETHTWVCGSGKTHSVGLSRLGRGSGETHDVGLARPGLEVEVFWSFYYGLICYFCLILIFCN